MPKLTEAQVDDLVDAWHQGPDCPPGPGLVEFLEWSIEDYHDWVGDSNRIPEMSEESFIRVLNKL